MNEDVFLLKMEISNLILVFKGVVSNETSKFGQFSQDDHAPRLSQNDSRPSYSASNLGNPSDGRKRWAFTEVLLV